MQKVVIAVRTKTRNPRVGTGRKIGILDSLLGRETANENTTEFPSFLLCIPMQSKESTFEGEREREREIFLRANSLSFSPYEGELDKYDSGRKRPIFCTLLDL